MEKLKRVYSRFQEIAQTRHFKYALFFISGLILGYLLGLINILHKASHLVKLPHFHFVWLIHFATSLGNFLPNINFLADVIAFEATAFALIIPLTIDILFRISERYDSDVIPKLFMKNIKFHVWVIAISIALNITLRFEMKDSPDSLLWKLGAWLVYTSFIVVSWIIVRYLIRFITFASDTKYIKDKLFKDAKKSLRQ